MSIQETESAAAANATHPRVSLADIEAAIEWRYDLTGADAVGGVPANSEEPWGLRWMPALTLLSLCILVMKNGFVVIGKSAPASPENFNAELGKNLAYEDAVRQLWPLMGFALKEKLRHA